MRQTTKVAILAAITVILVVGTAAYSRPQPQAPQTIPPIPEHASLVGYIGGNMTSTTVDSMTYCDAGGCPP